MVRYLTRRLGQAALVVAGVVVLTFIVTRLVPGDPAVAYAGPKATAEQLARVRAQFGLDDPLPVQLWNYARDLVTGDWGVSLHTKRPVLEDLMQAFPASLELVGAALIIAVVTGIPLGVLAARYRGRLPDLSIRLSSMLAVSVPVFWLALALQTLFASKLGWFPVAGEYDQNLDQTSPLREWTTITIVDALITGNWPIFTSTLWHLVLPATVMAAYPAGVVAQLTRATLIEESARDHARLERALGFGETAVLTRFSLRPALNPVLTLLALVFAYSLVNGFLVEAVFNWPGLGRYAADSIRALDTPAIAGVTLLVATLYVLVNLAVDLLQAVIDPRVRVR
ncbi:peptide ABC transporter permease [Thermobispora bispora]|jgi:peptide/nickel transport system permease protein|uniref:Binding-protein-dependent transport systems inner membrane component n=1 Tax=Thermobispora bispora (strain ATCC 19993 / DSM 43833 / CBS 139.67 / JCM 10125 / KCTC 9307 / NBRC 14880 / R51) TaxID=469371 RepID=D6Y704_THEBD|nr:ABC transporter permease [Thermobispora bispora]MBO2475494.1 ABC transporter permease [Actinomycetales bacterium]MDI9579525.1 ABC transporter permease [Thermobispora sp.]ADG89645.1 binding-protein-dependent transport systems inner membrane component [Thermobispora bispora DSM 43833]MBX6166702.1 ABC transporter permease [Thermobispora bispora]QSI49258.1 ABC transporter permease [Thermobispora bispora]